MSGFVTMMLMLYFLPVLIAAVRHATHGWGIVVLNLFLGWTMLGWLIALIWAVSDSTTKKSTT